MRHDSQLDLIHHSDKAMAEACYTAAQVALINPHEPYDARVKRHDQMMRDHERFKRLAAQRIPA